MVRRGCRGGRRVAPGSLGTRGTEPARAGRGSYRAVWDLDLADRELTARRRPEGRPRRRRRAPATRYAPGLQAAGTAGSVRRNTYRLAFGAPGTRSRRAAARLPEPSTSAASRRVRRNTAIATVFAPAGTEAATVSADVDPLDASDVAARGARRGRPRRGRLPERDRRGRRSVAAARGGAARCSSAPASSTADGLRRVATRCSARSSWTTPSRGTGTRPSREDRPSVFAAARGHVGERRRSRRALQTATGSLDTLTGGEPVAAAVCPTLTPIVPGRRRSPSATSGAVCGGAAGRSRSRQADRVRVPGVAS